MQHVNGPTHNRGRSLDIRPPRLTPTEPMVTKQHLDAEAEGKVSVLMSYLPLPATHCSCDKVVDSFYENLTVFIDSVAPLKVKKAHHKRSMPWKNDLTRNLKK